MLVGGGVRPVGWLRLRECFGECRLEAGYIKA